MSLSALLSELTDLGISVSAENAQLKVSAPKGIMTPSLQLRLREHKDELLAVLVASPTGISHADTPIVVHDRRAPSPLTSAQHRLWFLEQLTPGTAFLNLPLTVSLRGPLNVDALRWAVAELGRRHDALNSCIRLVADAPMQFPGADELQIEVIDVSHLSEDARDVSVLQRNNFEIARPFDVQHAPLIRFFLYRKSSTDHWFTFVTNHLVFDGWSHDILVRELRELYEARVQVCEPTQAPAVRFADFARWHEEWLRQPAQTTQLDTWRRELAGMPMVLELPTDLARPAEVSHRGITASWRPDSKILDRLRRIAQSSGATLNMLALATVEIVLARYTGQRDFGVGVPVHGRNRPETQELIGMFVNTLVLRSDIPDAVNFRDLLTRVRDRSLRALANQDLPFERLVQALQPARDRTRTPLYQAMYSYQEASQRQYQMADIAIEQIEAFSGATGTDATFWIRDHGDWALMVMELSADVFTQATADRWLRSWQSVLLAVAENPDIALDQIPILAAADERALVAIATGVSVESQEPSIPEMFEATVLFAPQHTALYYEDQSLKFSELDARSNQIAHALKQRGVTRDDRVAICLHRGVDLVAAILGVIKAGGAYVPLDPSLPDERVQTILADCGARLTIAALDTAVAIPAAALTLLVDRDAAEIIAHPATRCGAVYDSAQLAYVLYTSGSTGTPKGVMIEHGNVINFFAAMRHEVSLDRNGVWLAGTSTGFDISVLEILGSLCHGRTVVLVGDMVLGDARESRYGVAALARKHGVTHFQCTPSQARMLLLQKDSREMLSQLQQLIVGGEPLPQDLGDELAALVPGDVINGYGPTEVTVYSTMAKVLHGQKITIGHSLANLHALILDDALNPVPHGSIGELCMGGPSVARGYLGRESLTADRFVERAIGNGDVVRLYRTGDLVRLDEHDNIVYLGRNDHQVKIRGYRIELGEIETVLRRTAGIADAAVLAIGEGAERHLVAYVLAGKEYPAEQALRSQLRATLPEYMVPATFIQLREFPLTANGKIDRKAFPAPPIALTEREYSAPIDAVESALCEIWSKVLAVPRVGRTDDFFALGGHSLLAVRIFNEIECAYGLRLPLTALFDGPTVGLLAHRIRSQIAEGFAADSWTSVVKIRGGGSGAPFFCAAGMGGDPMNLIHLADAMCCERPFYGLRYRGVDGLRPPHTTMREMATELLADIRSVQPHGPYFIGGYSMGGVPAYEIAMLLQEQGEEIGLLILLDTYAPTMPGWSLSERVMAHVGRFVREGPSYVLDRMRDRKQREELERVRAELLESSPFALRTDFVAKAFRNAEQEYLPGQLAGKVLLLCASMRLGATEGIGHRTHESNGWRQYVTGELRIERVPVRHLDIVTAGAAPATAAIVTSALATAERARTTGESPNHERPVRVA